MRRRHPDAAIRDELARRGQLWRRERSFGALQGALTICRDTNRLPPRWLSHALISLLDDILAGKMPNAGGRGRGRTPAAQATELQRKYWHFMALEGARTKGLKGKAAAEDALAIVYQAGFGNVARTTVERNHVIVRDSIQQYGLKSPFISGRGMGVFVTDPPQKMPDLK